VICPPSCPPRPRPGAASPCHAARVSCATGEFRDEAVLRQTSRPRRSMVLESSTARTGSYRPGLRGKERCTSAAQVPISAASEESRSFCARGLRLASSNTAPCSRKLSRGDRATGTRRAGLRRRRGGLPRSQITRAWSNAAEREHSQSSMRFCCAGAFQWEPCVPGMMQQRR